MLLGNTVMRVSGPIIMLPSLDFLSVLGDVRFATQEVLGPTGEGVALLVAWSEIHGDSEMLMSECWSRIAPNIWLATSLRK